MLAPNLYSLRLQPRAAIHSPWPADTLFEHLCWQVVCERGREGLTRFLEPFAWGAPPFCLSDGFPCETWPRPIVARTFKPGARREMQAHMDGATREKKAPLLSQAQFECALHGEALTGAPPELARASECGLKNQIRRLMGTTTGADGDIETGSLDAPEELAVYPRENWPRVPVPVNLYIWARDLETAQGVERLFRALVQSDDSNKRPAGCVEFAVESMTPLTLITPDDANGFVALANFVPGASDSTNGYYHTVVKYSRLDEAALRDGKVLSPYKRPLLMFTAGSTFYADPIPPYVGRLVQGIHWEDETIAQGAFAPVVPIKLPPRPEGA